MSQDVLQAHAMLHIQSAEEVVMATQALSLPDPSKDIVLGSANNEDSNRLADDRNNNAQEKVQLQLPSGKDPAVLSKRERQASEDSPEALVINESPLATDLKSEVLKASTLRVVMRSPDDAVSSPRNQSILPHLDRSFGHEEKDRSGEYAHGKGYSAYFFSSSAPRTTASSGTEKLKVELDSIPKRQSQDFEQATASNVKMMLSPTSTESSGHLLPLVESDSSSKNRPKTVTQAASMQSTQVKPRCTPAREAVDPAKYFTLTDEPDGTKYACSKCGNVYKWRKSLNKHWKEKHDGETPSLHARPPAALLQRERFMTMPYRSTPKHSVFHPSGYSASSSKSSSLVLSPPRVHSTAQGGKNPHTMPPFMFAKFPVKDDSRDIGKTNLELEEPVIRPSRSDHSAAPLSGWPWMHSMNRPLQDFSSQTKLRVPAIDSIKSAHDHGQLKDTQPRMFSAIHSQHTLRGGPLDLSGTLVSQGSSANDNILDLSCKGTEVSRVGKGSVSVQDEPLDFSTKTSSGKPSTQSRIATPAMASNFSFLSSRHSDRKDSIHKAMGFSDSVAEIQSSPFPMHDFEKQNTLVCATCCMVCSSMLDLNLHFARHHMNVVYEASSDLMNSTQRGIPAALTSPNGTQLYKYLTMESQTKRSLACVVCGMSVQWSWMLAKHFEQVHASIQPNPYKKQPAVSASTASAFDVVSHGLACASTPCHRCDSCSFVTDSRGEFARHQMKHSLGKVKKEFPDSGSTHLQEDDFDREEDVGSKHPDGSLFDHFSDGIIDLEGEGTAIVIPQAPEETSFGSVPGCISRNKSKDAAASAKEMSASFGDLSFDEGMMMSGENTAIVIPQAPEETSLGSSQINVTPPGSKSGRSKKDAGSSAENLLPFKCELCEYRARWPSEMMQHMKNHSDEKPYQCPQCSYRSKWKWDVVKHLKRCGGGGSVKDVIDTSQRKKSYVKALLVDSHSRPSPYEGGQSCGAMNFHSIYAQQSVSKSRESLSKGPPNVTIYSTASDMHGSPSEMDNFDNCDSEDAISEDLSAGNKSEPGGSEASQSVHACPQCPFVGHSPAELKRHLRVHSDEKPYSCQTCCYSSKWKCDLKKHLKAYNHVSAVPLMYGGHGRKPVSWSSAADHASYAKSLDLGDNRGGDGTDSDLRALLQGGSKTKKGFGMGNGTSRPLSRDSSNIFGGITPGGRLKCRQCEFEAIDITSFLQHKKIHRSSTVKRHEGGSVAKAKVLPPLNHHRRKSFKQKRVLQVSPSRDEDPKMDGVGEGEPDEEKAEGKRFWESLGLRSTNSLNRERQSSDESDDNVEDSSESETEVESFQRGGPSKRTRCDNSPEFQKQCSATSNSCDSNTDTEVEYAEPSDLFHYRARRRDELGLDDVDDGRKYEGKYDAKMNRVSPALKQPFSAVRRGIRQGVTTTEAEDAVGMSKRKRKLRMCDKCGYITDNLTTLQRHAAKHGSGGRHRCSTCDYSVDRQHVLDYHVKIVHEGAGRDVEMKAEEWKCESMKLDKPSRKEKRAVESSALANGESYKALNRGGKRQIVCTTSVITFMGHEMEMIQKGNKTWYNCIKCHFVSSNITNAVNHAKQHGANKKYKCRYCDYSLNRQSSIANHMNSQHSHSDLLQFAVEVKTDLEKSGAAQWLNEWPGKDVQERYSLLDKMNLRWRRDVCIKCGFCSINHVKMLLHRLSHGRHDKTFACDTCSHRSTSSRLLVCHMKSHRQEAGPSKMLSCSYCPFQTVSATEHEDHLFSHDANRTYKCDECSFSTEHVIILKEHAELHCDGKGKGFTRCRKALKLCCRFCPFVSVSKMYFAIHLKHHNSTKKLACGVCNFRANVRNVFYHHQKLHR